jgi:hypothetical protein
MNNHCKNCDINRNIDKYKEQLVTMIVEKNYNLLDTEIIELSQLLDVLIDQCTLCEYNSISISKNLNG